MTYGFEVWQEGIMVASVWAESLDDARREAMHYAMAYAQEGPVEVRGKDGARLIEPESANDRSAG
jgi:hypothetical protein